MPYAVALLGMQVVLVFEGAEQGLSIPRGPETYRR